MKAFESASESPEIHAAEEEWEDCPLEILHCVIKPLCVGKLFVIESSDKIFPVGVIGGNTIMSITGGELVAYTNETFTTLVTFPNNPSNYSVFKQRDEIAIRVTLDHFIDVFIIVSDDLRIRMTQTANGSFAYYNRTEKINAHGGIIERNNICEHTGLGVNIIPAVNECQEMSKFYIEMTSMNFRRKWCISTVRIEMMETDVLYTSATNLVTLYPDTKVYEAKKAIGYKSYDDHTSIFICGKDLVVKAFYKNTLAETLVVKHITSYRVVNFIMDTKDACFYTSHDDHVAVFYVRAFEEL